MVAPLILMAILWVASISWIQPEPEIIVEHQLFFEVWTPVIGTCIADGGQQIACVVSYDKRDRFEATIPMPATSIVLPPEIGWACADARMQPGEVCFFQLYGVKEDGCESSTGLPPA